MCDSHTSKLYPKMACVMMNQYTFAGLPECKKNAGLPADIAIIGIPHGVLYSTGIPSHSEKAPHAIRRAAKRYAQMLYH